MMDGVYAPPPSPPPPPRRRSGTGLGGALMTMLVVAAVLGGVVAVHPGYEARTIRALVTDLFDGRVPVVTEPLAATGPGEFTFAMTQPGSDAPVGYDPCRDIEIVVNPQDAPQGYAEMVGTAVQRTSAATGLTMRVVGESDDRDFLRRSVDDPVLVGWASEEEVPELAGSTVGLGGSVALERDGVRHYVTGMVVMDVDVPLLNRGGQVAQSVLDHEFAHLVGLGHVDSTGELMHETPVRTDYGPGDLTGLAALGQVPCR